MELSYTMPSWHSYPSIYNLGHRYVADLLTVPVNVEEKIDGSQFSFGITHEGDLMIRSKGCIMNVFAPEQMFTAAVETVKRLAPRLHPGWTYRTEYLSKPKHNTLAYARIPIWHLIVFDVATGEEHYLPYHEKWAEAARLGLECVPLLLAAQVDSAAEIRQLLDTKSILGGQKIEGVVVKPRNYDLFGVDHKVLMGKFVSEAFKEIHGGEWRKANPTPNDIIDQIALDLKTPARWNKALQHLTEDGKIDGSPRDIGALMKEVPVDIETDCAELIRDRLYAFAWPHIHRKVTAGLPEWHKGELLKRQFMV